MTAPANRIRSLIAAAALCGSCLGLFACGPSTPSSSSTSTQRSPQEPARGGELVVTMHSEPRSFNRLLSNDTSTELLSSLTQAKLIRINRVTDEVEPWLAESWTRSDNGLRYTIKLRPGVAFADGHAFSSADVVFSFDAAYSVPFGVDALTINGKRITVTAVDPLTVELSFPSLFAAGMRLLDNVPMLPRHRLEAALRGKTFDRAWSVTTPPSDITGLGPFVLAEYAPGQRLVFDRNRRYWRKAANGTALPYLDRVVIEVVPEENTELLRLQSGQSDITNSEMPPEAYATMKRAADAGQVQLFDLGVGRDADTLWFNLKPGVLGDDPRAAWLQRDEFRKAISLAVDRQAFADAVFFGAGVPIYGPITPANKKWYADAVTHPNHDPSRAKQLLASIGLVDRNGDGLLEDAASRPVRFTLITQKGRRSEERGTSILRDELKKIGITVDVAMLEATTVIERILSGQYEAVYFRPVFSDTDPANNMDFWLSSGGQHFWNMSQKSPATDWEKRIDELMRQQVRALDENERKRLFTDVQAIYAEHEPALYFVAQRVFTAASMRVQNVTPAVTRPQMLWAPDTVAVRH